MESHNTETLSFQTEVQKLLHLMIHSLYSNKEIFLRELISNASDACDKLRFEALTTDGLFGDDPDLGVRIDIDKEARTLTVTDNGVGMSRDEVVSNLGTIARSGTREFVEALSEDGAKDAKLIGQFGVGFYSSFIVADTVTVLTRRAGESPDAGVRWTSAGEGEYTIETVEHAQRGTRITLHLREGEDEFLESFRLHNIVRKYADHIDVPVQMNVEKAVEKSDEDGEEAAGTVTELETINRASAFWTRPRQEIEDAEYQEFYKHVAHDFEDALAWTHYHVEGRLDYTALLYVPKRAPFDMWEQERRRGVKLYVQRVFIMEDAEQLMPRFLRFVRGVIDSNDLPLNVSRELLQGSKIVDSIRGGCTRKVLALLQGMLDDEREKYQAFWGQFGRVMKEGPAEDPGNVEPVSKLLLFSTTQTEGDDQTATLAEYVSRMKEDQEQIYYLTADTPATARSSPHLEVFRDKGLEVLLLTDRVDEWLVASLHEYDGKPLQSITRGELDLGSTGDEESQEKLDEEFREFTARVKTALGDKVEEVRLSRRLKDSPSCIVVPDGALGHRLERMLREAGQEVPQSKPILELNPTHPIVLKASKDEDQDRFGQWSDLLLEQAVLAEGGKLDDPGGFVRRLNELIVSVAG